MSAKDSLSSLLFHGTKATFELGDVITPDPTDEGGASVAHASESKAYASSHGPNVYKVVPVNKTEAKKATRRWRTEGPDFIMKDMTHVSDKGFRVVGKA
jgi:predicted sugar kinase